MGYGKDPQFARYDEGTFNETVIWYTGEESNIPVKVVVALDYQYEIEGRMNYYSYELSGEPLVGKKADGEEYVIEGQELKDFWEYIEGEYSRLAPFCGEERVEEDFDEPDNEERVYSKADYDYWAAEYFYPSEK